MKNAERFFKETVRKSDVELFNGEIYYKRSSIINWLEDYGKQEAIEFGKWVDEQHVKGLGKMRPEDIPEWAYSIQSMYKQFKQQS